MERPNLQTPDIATARSKNKLPNLRAARVLLALSLPFLALACGKSKQEYLDEGYQQRAVYHDVINPSNEDKYTTFLFRDRETQAKSEVDFHHLKSNPEEFERLVADVNGEQIMILNMQQENVPLQNIEFQHSTITFLDTKTDTVNTLQINRVKPTTKEAPEVTAYSLFLGKENPSHLGTIILSDRKQKDGERGEIFVSLAPGTFDYLSTSERHAQSYIQTASGLLGELKAKNFKDPRVDQAVWQVEDKNGTRTMNGILKGISYSIKSKTGDEKAPGYHLFGEKFKSSEIFDDTGKLIAGISTDHYQGVDKNDSIVYIFSTIENGQQKTALELKRTYRDKSETQTSQGTGSTTGITSGGRVSYGWTSIQLTTAVNFQNEGTMLYTYGPREANLTPTEQQENSKKVTAIFVLLGGSSILDGLNFQDSENEWRQSSTRIIDAARTKSQTTDMGFWLDLPVDSTPEGQKEALQILPLR